MVTGDWRFAHSLSVFFPAYNDAPSLPELLERTFALLRAHVDDYEVIVVNDGSADRTAEVLDDLRQQYAPHLRVITHEQNRGYGGALRSGFGAATKEFVFYTDGDGQYDPSELEVLLRAVADGTGLVNGYKIERYDPWHRVAIGWLYNRFARTLFGIKLRDIDCDFRLIRRSVLDGRDLTSTSGTICVELVRRLEMSGADVVEVPVHHYPRLHGRSQFFRVRSLATTFLQLCLLFWRLVMLPKKAVAFTCAAVAALSLLAYWRSLWLPLIGDDYVQIALARHYGPVSGWPDLMHDALYRCRATSLILSYWLDRWIGPDAFLLGISTLAIHILNGFLVFALGCWRPIGWRLSAVAACFFAVSQQHQEAVIWYAALPELLVFFFAVASFLFWVRGRPWISFGLFLLALASKESAVVIPVLLAGTALVERRRDRLWRVVPFAVCAGIYTAAIFAAQRTHLHFNDAGTFSLHAPFLAVLLRSSARLMWFSGFLALAVLWRWRAAGRKVAIAWGWIAITFLPYSFLTYMPFVPSRHTYLASVGLSFIIAAALLEIGARRGRAAVAVLAVLITVHHCSYLWTRKQAQFAVRAWPTEQLLRIAARSDSPVAVKCFPYDRSVANLALEIHSSRVGVIFDTNGVDLCTTPYR